MKMPIRTFTIVCILLLSAGCASTKMAEKAAFTALTQLVAYEREVGQKIKAETHYYEQVMDNAVQRINDLWENEQPFKLEQDAKEFAKNNQDAKPDSIGPKIVALFEGSMKSWASRDAAYESLMNDVVKTLAENCTKLDLEKAKIRKLRNKLQALSEASNDKEMLKLAIAFAKEVKDKLDEMKVGAKKASNVTEKKGGS